MKKIQLPHGEFTIVDDVDFEYLNQFKWHVQPTVNTRYVVRTVWLGDGKYACIRMHREILQPKNSSIKVDHIDGDGLNNQRSNLRLCSHSDNACNRRPSKGSSSNYLGVHYCKTRSKWVAQIQKNKQRIMIGVFNDEQSAAMAYNEAAIKMHGVFANPNQV